MCWVMIEESVKYYLYSINCRVSMEGEKNCKTIMIWWDDWIMDTAFLRVETRKECHNPVANRILKYGAVLSTNYSLSPRLRFSL